MFTAENREGNKKEVKTIRRRRNVAAHIINCMLLKHNKLISLQMAI
jgi:hypothetical protein